MVSNVNYYAAVNLHKAKHLKHKSLIFYDIIIIKYFVTLNIVQNIEGGNL